jgi:putative DNA methylase
MSQTFHKTRPSFLEAGLPCASLSAECQADNDARQRPPQNRLHIWWARRPPTISRVAVLSGLLPYDADLSIPSTTEFDSPVMQEDLDSLTNKEREHLEFYQRLLKTIQPTELSDEHRQLLLALRIFGDPARYETFRSEAKRAGIGLPNVFSKSLSGKRDQSVPHDLILHLRRIWKELFGLAEGEVPVLLDSMAGGGAIPLEGVRYGLKVFANELNPVAALTLKATIEYPARSGRALSQHIADSAQAIADRLRSRLSRFFPFPAIDEWWPDVEAEAHARYSAKTIAQVDPDMTHEQRKNTYLWLRIFPCTRCGLWIPLSTNFALNTKGKPVTHLAAFPKVPEKGQSDYCSFQIVRRPEWHDCTWPRPGFEHWDPRGTPTFKDGKTLCPRCGHVMDGDEVKVFARSREGGLAAQMYVVCSQVPVQLTYKNGDVKIRYLWRFRAPTQADLEAVRAAEAELARLRPRWEAQDLIPTEEIPEGDKTREPRNMGLIRWCDLFLPRQLLTNVVILEEIRAAQARALTELPEPEAEAVSVYLAFILSKVVNYNSVNTFWHYGRRTVAQTFSRHDFAFRPAFCEFEGARETVMWGALQVLGAYEALARLIHGEPVSVDALDDEETDGSADEAGEDADALEADEFQTEKAAIPQEDEDEIHLRPEVIVPTIICDDAAALSEPAPGTVHLICVDPPYYANVQYAELSNFFYVWLKRALQDLAGLKHLFQEPLAESSREAVANAARWQREANAEIAAWQAGYNAAVAALRGQNVKAKEAKAKALEVAGPKPPSAQDRAGRFYEDKMANVFRRSQQLLHPAGRMVVMFNHKETGAWRSLGMALIRAGFEIRSSVPIHTEAESSLNIRGLDAARSTVLLCCQPREETRQPVGNWATVQRRIALVARNAAEHFQKQGLFGTDLYLSALGPALRELSRNWPVTDLAERLIDLEAALEEAYKAVGHWRLEQIFAGLTAAADITDVENGFSADAVDRNTRTLWLWLDTFQGETAHSDDVRKLAKSLNVEPDDFKAMGLLSTEKDLFMLASPMDIDLLRLSRRLANGEIARGRASRQADIWEERTFPNFIGAAIWNGIALMAGSDGQLRGPEALRRWLRGSGYGEQREFRGAYAVTMTILEQAFGRRPEQDVWHRAAIEARRGWDLVVARWQG